MPERLLQLTPHPGLRRTFTVPSAEIAALDAVPDRAERGTILLLPGYTGSKEDFAPLLGPLAEQGWRVLAVDLPGQHESTGPTEPDDYAVDQLADSVRQLAAYASGPVHLLGHSFGGLVARAAVIAAPRAWRSLVLLDSGPAAIAGDRRRRVDALEPLLASAGVPAVYAMAERESLADPTYLAYPQAQKDFLRDRFLATSAASLQGMADAIRAEPDRVAELRATGVPTLVVYGDADDAWTPAVQHDMAERLGATEVVIADAIHSPNVQNPEATVAALAGFWSQHE